MTNLKVIDLPTRNLECSDSSVYSVYLFHFRVDGIGTNCCPVRHPVAGGEHAFAVCGSGKDRTVANFEGQSTCSMRRYRQEARQTRT